MATKTAVKQLRQKWFNKAVKGLAAQGFKKAVSRSAEGEETCMYYVPKSGHRCAIGQLLSRRDAIYLAETGGQGIRDMWRPFLRMVPGAGGQLDFFVDLQGAHDGGDSSAEMKVNLENVALDYDLTLPKELR